MRGLYAIYRKEIGHYFVSPIAYAVVGLFLLITGFFFNLYVQSAAAGVHAGNAGNGGAAI